MLQIRLYIRIYYIFYIPINNCKGIYLPNIFFFLSVGHIIMLQLSEPIRYSQYRYGQNVLNLLSLKITEVYTKFVYKLHLM